MSRPDRTAPGQRAWDQDGWWRAHRFLVLRRLSQATLLGLFLVGPWFGFWLVKCTLAASLTLDTLPLTDPFIALQSLLAGHLPESSALVGVALVLIAYIMLGGRVYCAWVCPINPITDGAHWLRERLDLDKGWRLDRRAKYWLLAAALLVSLVGGTVAWEAVNPITILHRELIYGGLVAGSLGWTVIIAVFAFDLLVSRRGWCGHVCPVGAFYGLVGRLSLLRVSAHRPAACDDCMDCYAVCPEPHVITPAIKAMDRGPVILSQDCSNCGRCIDVCAPAVFRYAWRGDVRTEEPSVPIGTEQRRQAA